MNRQDIRQQVSDMVQETLLTRNIGAAADSLRELENVVDCIDIDRRRILSSVDRALRTGANPLNVLLKLTGLRIVNVKNTVHKVDEDLQEPEYQAVEFSEPSCLLQLDKDRLQMVILKMADAILAGKQEDQADISSNREQLKLLHSELDRVNSELAQLRTDENARLHAIASWAQRELGDGPEDPAGESVRSLLEDLDIQVCWNPGEGPLSDGAMFTTLKRVPGYTGRDRPCLLFPRDTVLLRGLQILEEQDGMEQEPQQKPETNQ